LWLLTSLLLLAFLLLFLVQECPDTFAVPINAYVSDDLFPSLLLLLLPLTLLLQMLLLLLAFLEF
jgi:hypothetical protein